MFVLSELCTDTNTHVLTFLLINITAIAETSHTCFDNGCTVFVYTIVFMLILSFAADPCAGGGIASPGTAHPNIVIKQA